MPASRFEVMVGANGVVQFKLLDPHGKPIVVSRGYANQDEAFAGIRALKENASYPERYERHSKNGKLFFRLKSPSHQVVAEGGPYANEEEREAALRIIRQAAQAAIVNYLH